jgi:hypothetical protein
MKLNDIGINWRKILLIKKKLTIDSIKYSWLTLYVQAKLINLKISPSYPKYKKDFKKIFL